MDDTGGGGQPVCKQRFSKGGKNNAKIWFSKGSFMLGLEGSRKLLVTMTGWPGAVRHGH